MEKFDHKKARFFLLCWHRRARKTTLLINLLIRECVKNPKKVYAYIGPTYTQAKGIIWRDPNMLDSYLPMELVKRKNESELYVEFNNQSILSLKGADNPDSIRGQDYEGVAIDEWALQKREIWEEILRPVITQSHDRWAMFAFTPKGINHASDYWEKSTGWVGWHRSLLKASESGIVQQSELDEAKKQMPPDMYAQEFECDFLIGEQLCLIKPYLVEALKGVVLYPHQNKRIIACDPSQGGDECVVYVIENSKIIDELILHINDTMKIVGELMVLSQKYACNDFAIDTIGIGKGIVDRLGELGKNVNAVNSADAATDKERFYNLRTEMWWYLMDRMIKRDIDYPIDPELRRQLSSVRYKVINSNGKIQLEPKDETKKRLERSPDRADAFVYGIWGLRDVAEQSYYAPNTIDLEHMIAGGRGGY